MPGVSITNVRIFNGEKIVDGQDAVTIGADGYISAGTADVTFDGTGMTILPALWDTHVHLSIPGPDSTEASIPLLKTMASCGITGAVDCGNMSEEQRNFINSREDLPIVHYVSNFATATGSIHSKFLMTDKESIVDDVDAATRFVANRVQEGADYIKIVADIPGPSQEVVNQLSKEAKGHGKLSIVHAARKAAFDMALQAEPRVDIITHVPMDEPITAGDAVKMASLGIVSVPTLVMSEALCNARFRPEYNMSVAIESVRQLHDAGVTVLVGTDSNRSPIAGVKHGESVFRETELLAEAGMSPAEILSAATKRTADVLQLEDRGLLATGMRADLVLVAGDPTADIQALREVRKVWKSGTEIFSA